MSLIDLIQKWFCNSSDCSKYKDKINRLEQKISDLKKENKRIEEENLKLKQKIESYRKIIKDLNQNKIL